MTNEIIQRKYIHSGTIAPSEGLRYLLEIIVIADEVKRGLVTVESPSLNGSIAIFCSRYLIGARIDGAEINSFEALRQIFTLKEGSYSFVEVSADQISPMENLVAIDLLRLLDFGTQEDKVPPPLNEALEAVLQSGIQSLLHTAERGTDASCQFEDAAVTLPKPLSAFSATEDCYQMTSSPSLYENDACAPVPANIDQPEDLPTNFDVNKSYDCSLPPAAYEVNEWLNRTAEGLSDSSGSQMCENEVRCSEPSYSSPDELDAIKTPDAEQAYTPPIFHVEDLDAIPTPHHFLQADNNFPPAPESGAARSALEEEEWWHKRRAKPISDNERNQVGEIYREHRRTQTTREFIRRPKSKTGSEHKKQQEHVTFAHRASVSISAKTKIISGVLIAFIAFGILAIATMFRASEDPSKLLAKGIAHLKKGNRLEALLSFDQAVKLSPGNARAYLERARARVSFDDIDNALSDLAYARQLDSSMTDAYILAASTLLKRDAYQQALTLLDSCLARNNQSAEAHALRANIYAATGKYQSAIIDASDAIKLNPDAKAQTYRARALSLWKTGSASDAIKDFTKAIELKAGDSSTYVGRGSCYLAIGNTDKAIEDLSQALKIDSNVATAYIARGKAYKRSGDTTQAAIDFNRAIELQPNSPDAHAARGSLYFDQKRYADALYDFDKVLAAQPDKPDIQALRQDAYSRVKHSKPVFADWLKDDASEDGSNIAKRALLQKALPPYVPLRKMDPAIQELTETLKKSPNDTRARRSLAYAFMQNENIVAAAAQFQILDQASCLSAHDRYVFADMLERAGALNRAAVIYRALLAKTPSDSLLRDKLRRIYEQLAEDEKR